jgi:hypothetical protein
MSITVFLESNSGPYPDSDVAYSNALAFYGEKLEDDCFLRASCNEFVVKPMKAPRDGVDVR